jgi:3',5'-cyclic-AMP phosphodiesterase
MGSRRKFLRNAALTGVVSALLPLPLSSAPASQRSSAGKKRSLRVAHITDVHILDKPNAERFFAQVLREINNLTDKPDFIINTGDTVMDENQQTRETVELRWKTWRKAVETENKLPIYSALGNHDVWYGPNETLDAEYKTDKRYGKQWAIEELKLPNRYYAFEKNGWYFIALDSINGEKGYQLDEEQFEWLKQQLQGIPKEKPVCVFNHVPILSMGALMYLTKRKPISEITFPSGDMHNDHQRIKDLFFQHRQVKLCLSGHVHYVDEVEYLGVKYLCNGAVSGNWWGTPLALDEFPPVYSLIDLFDDGTIEHQNFYYNTKV